MDTTKSSAPAHPFTRTSRYRDSREDRARILAAEHHHEIAASHRGHEWKVPSCTAAHSYSVVYSYTHDVEPSCECPDWQYRGLPCKHLYAAALVAAELHRKGGNFIRPEDLEEIAELTGIAYWELSSAFTGERKNLCLDVVKAAVAAEPEGSPEDWGANIRLWAKATRRGQYRSEVTGGGFLSFDYL